MSTTTTTTTTKLKIYVQRGMEGPIECRVDSNHAISYVVKEQQEDIMFRNKLLLNQKETFQFYEIQDESTLHIIKKQVNISLIDHDKVILSNMIQVSPHHTIMQVLQQNPLLKRVIGNHHHFMCNGILIEKDNKEQKTLYQLGIHDDVFIYIEGTIVIIHGQKPLREQEGEQEQQLKKKKKNRCAFIHCSDKICKVIGDCRYCQSSYCSRHRLPEAHTCKNLTGCKRVAHERNSVKLIEERCVANKI